MRLGIAIREAGFPVTKPPWEVGALSLAVAAVCLPSVETIKCKLLLTKLEID